MTPPEIIQIHGYDIGKFLVNFYTLLHTLYCWPGTGCGLTGTECVKDFDDNS